MIAALGGQTVTGPSASFTAIFDNGYSGTLSDPVVEGTGPALSAVRSSDLVAAAVSKGSTLTIGGTDYRVMRIEPDGTGMSVVALRVL